MRKTFSDGRIIAFLCAALVAEVSLLLWHLRDGDVGRRIEGARIAGQVIVAHNQLRRRGLNSLVWEPSLSNEAVYYHDSILTLEGSEAQIRLEGGTEIHVSENTLVTVEPPENQQSGEIRLKFVRGNLRARNTFASTEVAADTVTVQMKPGSDIDLRQVNGGQIELRVQRGDAEILSATGSSVRAGAGEFIRMERGQVQRLRVDETLVWETQPAARIYTHEKDVRVPVSWKGSADQLVIQSLSVDERAIEVSTFAQKELRLALGQHRLLLRSGDRSSVPIDVQVLKAPVIHLLSPLPRDRVELDERIVFQWMQVPDVAGHELHVKGRFTNLRERVNNTEHALSFGQEEDVEWNVYGVDPEGFRIPPLYFYPLYLRANPLAPPKLKSPSLRRPAQENSRGAFWFGLPDILFPRAYAEEAPGFEALFTWEAVRGADQYVIEISETADFRNPVMVRTVRRNEFLWKGFLPKPYFWRVASGSRSGRLGRFSEPVLVNLENRDSNPGEIGGVAVRPVSQPKPQAAKKALEIPPVPQPPVVEEPLPIASKPAVVNDARRQTWSLLVRPGYQQLVSSAGNDNVKARLKGIVPVSVRAELPVMKKDERTVRLSLSHQRFRFEPEPREAYPFQADLEWSQTKADWMWFHATRRWGYGIGLQQRARVLRTDDESVEVKADWALGPRIESSWVKSSMAIIVRGGVMVASSGVGGLAEGEARYNLWKGLTCGAGVDFESYLGSRGGNTATLYLSLGFEF